MMTTSYSAVSPGVPSEPPETSSSNPLYHKVDYGLTPFPSACELPEMYSLGNYHPIDLGDVFQDQYQVIRKLGYGSYSTVWLVFDDRESRFRALKVMVAEVNKARIEQELDIYERINKISNPRDRIIRLVDSFEVTGPNGTHACLVSEVAGPTVQDMLWFYPQFQVIGSVDGCFPKEIATRVLRDILLGLVGLHNAGIIHSDLHFGNILFDVNLQNISPEQLRQQSKPEPLDECDGIEDSRAPKQLYRPEPLNFTDLQRDPLVKLSDFSAAFCTAQTPGNEVLPVFLRAPEVVLKQSTLNEKTEIWNFGCLAYEVLTGHRLFQVSSLEGSGTYEPLNDRHLVQMTETLGPLPRELSQHWRRKYSYYNSKNERIHVVGPLDFDVYNIIDLADDLDDDSGAELDDLDNEDLTQSPGSNRGNLSPPLAWLEEDFPSLEDRFAEEKPPEIGHREAATITRFLRWILNYDPSKRPTAAEILNHRWMRSAL